MEWEGAQLKGLSSKNENSVSILAIYFLVNFWSKKKKKLPCSTLGAYKIKSNQKFYPLPSKKIIREEGSAN